MKLKKVSLRVFSLLFLAAASAHGAVINYTPGFSTTGSQASASGASFADYSEWTLHLSGGSVLPLNYEAKVDTSGELVLNQASSNGTYPTTVSTNPNGSLYATVAAAGISSASAFDLTTHALNISVDLGSRFTGGSNTSRSVGIVIGDFALIIHPGDNVAGGSRYRWQDADYPNAPTVGNTGVGFVMPAGLESSLTSVNISIIESLLDPDKYSVSYSIGSYNQTREFDKSLIDNDPNGVTRVGLWLNGAGDANFQNFTITQIPEPAAALLGGLGLLALLRRRRD